MLSFMLLAASMLPSINIHPDGMEEYAFFGTARGPDGRNLEATLWISCVRGGSVGLQRELKETETGFDFADFIPSCNGNIDWKQSEWANRND
jgi:hypothetical protein